MKSSIAQQIKAIAKLPLAERIDAINQVKIQLHEISPFATEPVDCVLWVKQDDVHANDYNPNSVAPPEMELLKVSILSDGYTQPIVAMPSSLAARANPSDPECAKRAIQEGIDQIFVTIQKAEGAFK